MSSNIAVWGPEHCVLCSQWTGDTRSAIDGDSALISSSSSWDTRSIGCCRRSSRSFIWCPNTCRCTDDELFASTASTRRPSRWSAATTSPSKSSWGSWWTRDNGTTRTYTGCRSTSCVSRAPSRTTSSVTTKHCGSTATTCCSGWALILTSGFPVGQRIEQTAHLKTSDLNTWNDSESSTLETTTFLATCNAAYRYWLRFGGSLIYNTRVTRLANLFSLPMPTISAWVARSRPSVCLSVRSITQKRMIPKWHGFEVERSKVKVTGSISAFFTLIVGA